MDQSILREGERLDEVNERIKLIQRIGGLTFGSDAFLLSAFCNPPLYYTGKSSPSGNKRRTPSNERAADLGCGTGIISLLLAARGTYAHVTAVEVQPVFAELTRRNVDLNGFSHTVSVLCKDVRDLTPTDFGGELDVILANPPYMRPDVGFPSPNEEKQIARHEVLGDIRDFAAAASRCLRYGGKFYTVYRPDRLCSLMTALREAKLEPKRMIFVHDHQNKEPAMVLTEAVRGGKEGLMLLPPLFLHETTPNGVEKRLSPQAQAIYDEGHF